MVTALVIIIMVLFLLAFWRRMHQSYEELRFKYRLYELRDNLRYKAIKGEVDPNHWLFDYFDNTLSKAISRSYYITLFSILGLNFKYQGKKEVTEFSKKLNDEIKNSPVYKEILDSYLKALGNYIIHQHAISAKFIIAPIAFAIFGVKRSYEIMKYNIENLFYFPETSDSGNQPHPA